MELVERTLPREGFDLHYWVGGATGAPVVVFTHGATIDHGEWEWTLPLVGEHFGVVAWDVRGHGRSRPATFSVKAAVDDLRALLDALDLPHAILVGHSMGGNLHQEFVFCYPERVQAMVCLGCTWNFQKLSRWEAWLVGIAGPLLSAYPHRMLREQSLRMTVSTKAGRDLLRPAMESHSKADMVGIMTALVLCLHEEPGYAIRKPLLLMVGDQDATGNIRKAMPLWALHEPDCRLVVIPQAKHGANLDNPDVFHKELMAFLVARCAG
jgi:pimeloyl-ACP methyl ester carboxylesterase